MSSGFVSGGTADAPIERGDEWLTAQKEIEANRQRKAAEARQSGGRSLFETLEANKVAKQEAFEEANRLKNQFRALDEDEIEFLDSVLESTRAEEERVKRETAEGLELFRRQQDEADKKVRRTSDDAGVSGEGPATIGEEQWVAGGRKRKRTKEMAVLKGVKVRRSSSTIDQPLRAGHDVSSQTSQSGSPPSTKDVSDIKSSVSNVQPNKAPLQTVPPSESSEPGAKAQSSLSKAGLGLVDYGSDEDDD